jgi:hypothetical protein
VCGIPPLVHKHRVRRIFGPKMEGVEGAWRRLHNEELHNLYTSPNIIQEDEMGGACSADGINDNCLQYFGWKT